LIAAFLRGKVFIASWAFAGILFLAIFPQFIPGAIVDREKDPHNYYLYVASQMGLPALVIFLCILILQRDCIE